MPRLRPNGDLAFNIVSNPDSNLRTLAIVSVAVANNNGVNPCVGGPSVFVGPIPIDENNSPNFTKLQVPSAFVEQMVAAIAQDGFVVMLSMNCNSTCSNFADLSVTRDPFAVPTDLVIRQITGPAVI